MGELTNFGEVIREVSPLKLSAPQVKFKLQKNDFPRVSKLHLGGRRSPKLPFGI
jgi:hypothetical protein